MTCNDCEKFNKCEINPAEDEFICDDFKAKKKSKLKKILTITGIAVGTGLVSGVLAYLKGKKDGNDDAEAYAELKASIALTDYIDDVRKYAAAGDFATEFVNTETGEKNYVIHTFSKEAPDWWSAEDTERFNLKEDVLKEI